jgi:hypothetical protein
VLLSLKFFFTIYLWAVLNVLSAHVLSCKLIVGKKDLKSFYSSRDKRIVNCHVMHFPDLLSFDFRSHPDPHSILLRVRFFKNNLNKVAADRYLILFEYLFTSKIETRGLVNF